MPARNPRIGAPGPANYRWRGGFTITVKGYKRFSAGPLRGLFAHRVTIERLLGGAIPAGFTVHHMPGVPRHCDHAENLVLMEDRLHRPLQQKRGSRNGNRA